MFLPLSTHSSFRDFLETGPWCSERSVKFVQINMHQREGTPLTHRLCICMEPGSGWIEFLCPHWVIVVFFRLLFCYPQSSDLSFGFVGSSRFDSPESNKLWRNRVSFLLKVKMILKYVVLQKIHLPPSFCLMFQKFRCPRTRIVNELSNMVESDYQRFYLAVFPWRFISRLR